MTTAETVRIVYLHGRSKFNWAT